LISDCIDSESRPLLQVTGEFVREFLAAEMDKNAALDEIDNVLD